MPGKPNFEILIISLTIKNNANITCPNDECLTNTEHVEKSFKYIKYDEDQMKFLYVCEGCGQCWTN